MTTFRSTARVGRLRSRHVKRAIHQAAFEAGVTVNIQEHRAFLDSVLLIEAEGESDDVVRFADAYATWRRAHLDGSAPDFTPEVNLDGDPDA